MTRTLRTMAVLAVVLAISVLNASAQTASIHADLLKDWTALKDTMMKIADAMPEAKFSFKATPPERTYGEQILHVAQANVGLLGGLGGKATAPSVDMKATKKADVLKALSDSFDYGTALLKEQTDQTMMDAVMAPYLGSSSRTRVYSFLMGHAWDIYGQLAVYLRLNGKVPPASQRP